MKIGYIVQSDDVGGVEYHRLYKPLSLMGLDVTRCVGVDKGILEHGFDVVIFNRCMPCLKQSELIADLKGEGVHVICDLDDTWVLDGGHYLTKSWKQSKLKTRIIGAISEADEVWVTHQHLAELTGRLNPNVHIIPNAIDMADEQWQSHHNGNGRIGWVGGITHVNDILRTVDAWGEVEPIICGYQQNEPEWKRLSDKLTATYIKGMDVWNYAQLYEQFDIAIAPLTDSTFNTYKSNLKILEAGAKGKPIFVQDMHPYTDKATGIHHVTDWKQAIAEAKAMSEQQIQDEGAALRQYVAENYDLRKVNELRLKRLQ
jgi:hypothetical protein